MKPRDNIEQRYPTRQAREAADAAIDELPETSPMTDYIDTWLRVYRARGGIFKDARR